jgi:hypothetical protein
MLNILAILGDRIKERELIRRQKAMDQFCWRPLRQEVINTIAQGFNAAEAELRARYEAGDLDPVLMNVLKRYNVFGSHSS